MAKWTMTDEANGAPMFAPATVNLKPNTANRDAMYGNTTADAFVTNQTIGVYAVDDEEIAIGGFVLSGVTVDSGGTAGSYVPGEPLTFDQTGATFAESATLTATKTRLRTVAIDTPGTGYANGDTVTFAGGINEVQAVLVVTTGEADTIPASLAISNTGVFTTNPALLDSPTIAITGDGVGLTVDITTALVEAVVSNPGSYSVEPTSLTSDLEGDTGAGAEATLAFTQQNGKGLAHTGWVKRTVGTGGRAGVIQTEVLVAGRIVDDNDADDAIYPNA